MVVGRLLSYWDVPFSGAMLNFGGGKFQGDPERVVDLLETIAPVRLPTVAAFSAG